MLRNNSKVKVDIQPYYEGDLQRPTGFIVSYKIDGELNEPKNTGRENSENLEIKIQFK